MKRSYMSHIKSFHQAVWLSKGSLPLLVLIVVQRGITSGDHNGQSLTAMIGARHGGSQQWTPYRRHEWRIRTTSHRCSPPIGKGYLGRRIPVWTKWAATWSRNSDFPILWNLKMMNKSKKNKMHVDMYIAVHRGDLHSVLRFTHQSVH